MDEARLEYIRKFVWNYKYSEQYNNEIYQIFVELIKCIDDIKKD